MTRNGAAYVFSQFLLFVGYVAVPRWETGTFPQWLRIGGALLIPYGTILVGWSIWHLRRALSALPAPRAHAQLVTTGPFRRLRHPIYSGLLLAALGYALWSAHVPRLLVTGMLTVLFWYKARYEETLLRAHFPAYAAYQARTGRLWPRWR